MKFKNNVAPKVQLEIGAKLVRLVYLYQEFLEVLDMDSKWVKKTQEEFCEESLCLDSMPEDIDDCEDEWGEYWADAYIKENITNKFKEIDELVRSINNDDSLFDMQNDVLVRDSWIRTVNTLIGVEQSEGFKALSDEEYKALDKVEKQKYDNNKGTPPFKLLLHEETSKLDIFLLPRPLVETLRERLSKVREFMVVMRNNISAFCFSVFDGFKVIENSEELLGAKSTEIEKLIENQIKGTIDSEFSLTTFLSSLQKEGSFAEHSVPEVFKNVILSHLPKDQKERLEILEQIHVHSGVVMQWDMLLLSHDLIALDQKYLDRLALRDSGEFTCVANRDDLGLESLVFPDDDFVCATFYNIDLLDIVEISDVAQFIEYQEQPNTIELYENWINTVLKQRLDSGLYVNEAWSDTIPLSIIEEGFTNEFGGDQLD